MRGDGPGSGGGGGTATQQHHQSKFDPSAGGGGMSREHRTREKDSYERERDNLKEKMNGGHRPVDQIQLDLVVMQPCSKFFDLAAAEQQPGLGARKAHDFGPDHIQIGQSGSQCHRLFQRRNGVAALVI